MKEGNSFSLTDQEVAFIISILENGFREHWMEHKLLNKPEDFILYIHINLILACVNAIDIMVLNSFGIFVYFLLLLLLTLFLFCPFSVLLLFKSL